MAADKNKLVIAGKFHRFLLIERLSRRAHDNRAAVFYLRLFFHGFYGTENRLGLHHHACAAAVRRIIHLIVLIKGKIARIGYGDVKNVFLHGSLRNAGTEYTGEHFGK